MMSFYLIPKVTKGEILQYFVGPLKDSLISVDVENVKGDIRKSWYSTVICC